MVTCQICNNSQISNTYTAREMMFGFREEFTYVECHQCGCLQIIDPPDDLAPYYPKDYYSFSIPKDRFLKRFLKRQRAARALGQKTLLGELSMKLWKTPPALEWFKKMDVGFSDAILDVGSGVGHLLLDLYNIGFKNLTGIDPNIEGNIVVDGCLRIFKKSLDEISGTFDCIMMNQSLEHIPNQVAALKKAEQLLPADRFALIRIPVMGKYAWRTYGINWVQLDTPRHLYLHTETSMSLLAEKAGFIIDDVVYDSNEFQFLGSEQYLNDIPLYDENSYKVNPHASMFSSDDVRIFREKAIQLNEERDGDQACFYLKKL